MSNIYLNEFDRFMKHQLKPLAYLRYGDDWLCFVSDEHQMEGIRSQSIIFLNNELHLSINPKIDRIQPVYKGVSYLGVDIWPNGRRLVLPVRERITNRLDNSNAASYKALIHAHENSKRVKQINWRLID